MKKTRLTLPIPRSPNKARGVALAMLLLAALAGCGSSLEREYDNGVESAKKGQHTLALSSFDKVIARSPDSRLGLDAAREAARVAFFELKDFNRSAKYYEMIVLGSPDEAERLSAQKQITAVFFDHLSNYGRAIVEINKVLPLVRDPSEKLKYKMDLARAYYYQNNFFQAEMEVDEFLRLSKNEDLNFQMLLLKANIVLARKDLQRAAEILKEMIKANPKKAQKENVGLTLAVAYEEMKDYKKAIETLQEIRGDHAMPDYIDVRIKRLQERVKNQPGARGFRK
ncbi:MAG: tetratricopeptide repeat protein [Bdellovibrionaceae bacterium]|nr:tetratricopeptide repeat protein [Pseudobdellovibrionaceae bacterium]